MGKIALRIYKEAENLVSFRGTFPEKFLIWLARKV
jgi:hypothetical protein